LRRLIQDPDPEVRQAALLSVTRRPAARILDDILPLLVVPDFSQDARSALAAVGDAAVPAVARLLAPEHGTRTQSLAASTLAQIGSARAIDSLLPLARSGDRALRHLGLRSLSRIRVQNGVAVLPRALAHRFFLRDLGEYRAWLKPALRLEGSREPELRLL